MESGAAADMHTCANPSAQHLRLADDSACSDASCRSPLSIPRSYPIPGTAARLAVANTRTLADAGAVSNVEEGPKVRIIYCGDPSSASCLRSFEWGRSRAILGQGLIKICTPWNLTDPLTGPNWTSRRMSSVNLHCKSLVYYPLLLASGRKTLCWIHQRVHHA
jgi:hypothetical protein